MHKTIQFIRFLCLMTILLVLPTGQASAALRGCRTDPIFRLSNGDVLTVTVQAGTPADNIINIHYVLHVPPGVTVRGVTYTGGPKQAMKETYIVSQDGPAKGYTTETVVTTMNTASVTVIATTRLNGGLVQSAWGYNGDHLRLTLARP